MSTPHVTIKVPLTAEQSAYLVARGEPQEVSASSLHVVIGDDGTTDITIPDELIAAIAASVPAWVEGWRKADAA